HLRPGGANVKKRGLKLRCRAWERGPGDRGQGGAKGKGREEGKGRGSGDGKGQRAGEGAEGKGRGRGQSAAGGLNLGSVVCAAEMWCHWSCHERSLQRETAMICRGTGCALSGRMEKIDDYKKLVAWQLSMELGDLIDEM